MRRMEWSRILVVLLFAVLLSLGGCGGGGGGNDGGHNNPTPTPSPSPTPTPSPQPGIGDEDLDAFLGYWSLLDGRGVFDGGGEHINEKVTGGFLSLSGGPDGVSINFSIEFDEVPDEEGLEFARDDFPDGDFTPRRQADGSYSFTLTSGNLTINIKLTGKDRASVTIKGQGQDEGVSYSCDVALSVGRN